eukprot:5072115-Lingulodinium_polyedra.AAC.1
MPVLAGLRTSVRITSLLTTQDALLCQKQPICHHLLLNASMRCTSSLDELFQRCLAEGFTFPPRAGIFDSLLFCTGDLNEATTSILGPHFVR